MGDISNADLRERLERRFVGLQNWRQPWEESWREVSEQMQGMRSRWLSYSGQARAGIASGMQWMGTVDKYNAKRLDSTGRNASKVLANGLASGLVTPSRPWFRLTTVDPEVREQQDVKGWLKQAQDRIYELFATTNFYDASKAGYMELGLFGIEAGIIERHWRRGAVTTPLQAGQFWVACGDELIPDTLYRSCPMTVAQVVKRFRSSEGRQGWSRTVQTAYDRGELDMIVPVLHAMEPNPDRIPDKLDKSNMEWRSVYWECGQDRLQDGAGILEFGGDHVKPFWAARWEPVGGMPYSNSPGQDATPDCKTLQVQNLRLQQGIDLASKPHMGVPSSIQDFRGLVPGGVTTFAAVDKAAVGPLAMVDPRIAEQIQNIERTQKSVRDAYMEDFFLAIMNSGDETLATVANLRNQERYSQLGPVIEANMHEKLEPIVDIAFSIVVRSGLVPKPPASLHGMELKMEYISTLAQLQRSTEITAIGQSLQFGGYLAGLDPGIMDNYDLDEAVNYYHDLQGGPPQLMRSKQQVEALRAGRAQQQQAAQLQAAAPAAKDGAAAAATLAGIDPSKLAQLTGAAGYA